MSEFDPSQLAAIALDPGSHASVLGAPGSGKTTVLIETFLRQADAPGWSPNDLLVLAPNRLVAKSLLARIEAGYPRPLNGSPVRTAASLGFTILSRARAVANQPAPRLLTGTAHDEAIERELARVTDERIVAAGLTRELTETPAFRAELRELWRVLDDAGVDVKALRRALTAADDAGHGGDSELRAQWEFAAEVISCVRAQLAQDRPHEFPASGLMRAARDLLAGPSEIRVPRLILVDDAQELTEGGLALLAACANRGSRVRVFGDPDIATSAFQGGGTAVLSRLESELRRRGHALPAAGPDGANELVVLDRVYRHGPQLREFVGGLTGRIGAAGAGVQRRAEAAGGAPIALAGPDPIQFARAASSAEQLGALAHRLRERRLGLGPVGLRGETRTPVPWSQMAVICRSRGEAARAARLLAAQQVPTGIAAGGIVLREHTIVRELIRLMQHALDINPLAPDEVLGLVGGTLGGLDPIGVRRLRAALVLQEKREARERAAEVAAGDDAEADGSVSVAGPRPLDEVVAEAFAHPGVEPVVDSRGGRALRRVALTALAGARMHQAGGTAREVLWALWDASKLAVSWEREALSGKGPRSAAANRSLDATVALFYALQRHEEQDSDQSVADLLVALDTSALPEDSLAARSVRDTITVTTPQGAIGREFAVVAILGPQEGVWPNLRARGSMLGSAALERWLRGGEASAPGRRETMHDELRLFAQSCSRATGELLVLALADDEQHPGPFFGFGRAHAVDALPSSRITLRGSVAEMRRRVTADPTDEAALAALVTLAREGVPGADPADWYGVAPPSTMAPLTDLAGDPEATVGVSPSQLERSEECPLDWVISKLGGGDTNAAAGIGTLLHHALETIREPDPERILAAVTAEWDRLPFDAEWESERLLGTARAMSQAVADYLREFEGSSRELAGTEASFALPLGRAMLTGIVDRVETVVSAAGSRETTVLDLKTGRTKPSAAEVTEHAQLQAYQLATLMGAFAEQDADAGAGESADAAGTAEAPANGGARLLYVHPDATGRGQSFREFAQEPLDAEKREAFVQRVAAAAEVMAAGRFTARVEHHCTDEYRPGSCQIHIVPAVSAG